MRNKSKHVYAVGVNDADYMVQRFSKIGGRQKLIWACEFYGVWKHMIERCYSARRHSEFPTYAGCSVSPQWHTFSTFREWMALQDWKGNHLDKDILIPGNKVYGPDACVFISGKLNTFMNDHGADRGEYPIGVTLQKSTGKFISRCSNPFTDKREYLGVFICPEDAHEAWRKRKHELACQYADMQTDERIAQALRTRYAK